ncbi:aminotransferase [Pullulanibacillus camelliae]|uniref:Aminotransferase n=1 Tax=Pullulanibacillus camelliae TaxID=1707096 RepID=A0A8J2VRU2_9BACL|nr:pyridoxal phosphate-dependent aminotransferase [Pullulanibacillus camelliae]GGE39026.1 aminotransferase [Pullulanibacillus camelliae]
MELSQRVKNISPSSTLAITAKAKELKASGIDVIGLAAGEPDFNTPEPIIEAAFKAAKEGQTKYTATSGISELKAAIVQKMARDSHLTISPEEIIITTGAKHALYLTFQALLNPGDEVIIPSPYWVSYTEQVKLADGVPVIVEGLEENDFKVTVERIKEATTAKTKALILNSPSNPTGMIYTADELREIGQYCLKNDIVVVSDEIYEKLVYDGAKAESIVSVVPDLKNQSVIINGVSKSYAMTGWRIGYAVAEASFIKAMTNVASHSTSNPTSVAQYAALAAFNGSQEPVETMRQAFEDRLNQTYEKLVSIPGFKCIKPQGAFYLFPNAKWAAEMTGFTSVTAFVAALVEEAKIAMVPGEGFGSPDNVRLSYATSLDNLNKALERLNTFMENHIK